MTFAGEIEQFVTAAVALLDRRCGLVAAYVVGSVAAGDVAGAASDVDLLLVTDQALPERQRLDAGEQLADLAAASPLRGLEAVLYRADALAHPRHPLAYELNVNAGPHMQRSVTTSGDESFWFLLDVAIARQQAIAQKGPPAHELIGPVPDADVRAALLESVRWHRRHVADSADAALNACRALHWLATGQWLSKSAAGKAYLATTDDQTVRAALELRKAGSDGSVDAEGVRRLQVQLETALRH